MPTLVLPETSIVYETIGSGLPLVLIPGFASGAWSWSWQAADLSQDFRVITFDPRGMERSPLSNGATVSIELIADDIALLLTELGVDSAHILGISFGGFVAQDFALRYPEKLGKLVLASTGFGGPNHVLPAPDVLAAFAMTTELNSPDRIRKYLATAFLKDFQDTNPADVGKYCMLREQSPVSEAVYRQQFGSAMVFNSENDVSRITAETLVITGDSDKIVPPQNSVNLAGKIPNSRLEVIKNAGHMAFIEQSGEFNRLVREFLAA